MVQFADDHLYLTYQIDNDPGLSPDMGGYYSENRVTFMEVDLGWNEGMDKEGIFVDFRINQDSIYEGDTVWFQNLSCGCPFPYSFTWGFEGGSPGSSNESNPAVVYNNAGIFDVNLHAGNGQSTNLIIKPDYITVYPLSALSEEREVSSIRVFPNPAVSQLNIQFDKPAYATVRVRGMMGQIVFEKEYGYTGQIRINQLELPAGIYMVEVSTIDAKHCKMIVIGE
jgi:PKD repeat protein